MRTQRVQGRARGLKGSVVTLGFLLALSACGLDKVEIPDLEGPSELALSIRMQAIPDVLVANGVNTARIVVTVHDQNGDPKANQAIFFAIADESGNFADIGTLSAKTAFSGGSGVAEVIYRTPPRTDSTANQTVLVAARPIGDDANGQIYRFVRIELRSAEARQFPEVPGNTPPTCTFIIEPAVGPYKVNTSVLFQTTASDPDGDAIIRYVWDFGDGTPGDDAPDVEHHYGAAGAYSVTHGCTDADGGQGTTSQSVTVVP